MRITNRMHIVMAALLAVVFIAGSVGAGDDIMFGYKFEEGYSSKYKLKFSQEVDFGGFAMNVFADFEVEEKCTGVTDSTYTMEATFIKVEASRMVFDNIEEHPMSEQLAGQTVVYSVDAHGDVSGIKAAGYIDGWAGMKDIVEQVIESSYVYMPDAAVAAGGEWQQEAEKETTDDGMEVVTSSKFEFKEMKQENGRDCAKIVGKMENTFSGVMTTPQGAMEADGTGAGEYECYFDPGTTTIVKLKGRVDVKMDMIPESGGDAVETTVAYQVEKELL
jgi:hypothetical protein